VSPLVIAHRGASARLRENTLEAFVEARRLTNTPDVLVIVLRERRP
jgi:glycerophosphoryl diester phosphodiesterase